MRCARCGNENLDGNRFCGMCGATLLTTSAPRRCSTSAEFGNAAYRTCRTLFFSSGLGGRHAVTKSPILPYVDSSVRAGTIHKRALIFGTQSSLLLERGRV